MPGRTSAHSAATRPEMFGGNAALAARDPSALLVDAAGRWHVDGSAHMAQTAHQMEALRDIGFGDPYEFARPGERVPIEAVQFWQDKIAAQGPVIDGHASLSLDTDGALLATIHPTDGSPPIVVEVEGTPLVAVGFPTETTPSAARDLTPRKALGTVQSTLAALANDPTLGPAATRVRNEIGALGIDGTAASRAYQIGFLHVVEKLGTSARGPLVIDSPDQQDQDPQHIVKMLEFIRDERPPQTQMILGLVDTEGISFGGTEIVLDRKHSLLSEEAFDQVGPEVQGLIDRSLESPT